MSDWQTIALWLYGFGVSSSIIAVLVVRFGPRQGDACERRIDWRRLAVWLFATGPLLWIHIRLLLALQGLLEMVGVLLLLGTSVGIMVMTYVYAGVAGYVVAGISVLMLITLWWRADSSPDVKVDRWMSSLTDSSVVKNLLQRSERWFSPPVKWKNKAEE